MLNVTGEAALSIELFGKQSQVFLSVVMAGSNNPIEARSKMMNPWILAGISVVAAVVSQLLFKAGVSATGGFDMSVTALPEMLGKVLINGYIVNGLIFYALGVV
jgi:hypothetical protein